MGYTVKEIFLTLQGEGPQAGRRAVFCRFSGCTLWCGRDPDRATATCRFCDTDFVGPDGTLGGNYVNASALSTVVVVTWAGSDAGPFVLNTGREPHLPDSARLNVTGK